MQKIFLGAVLSGVAAFVLPFCCYAHSALFDCFDNGDGTI